MRDVSQADFAALFNAHFDSLLAYTRRRTPQLADAEDALAETYVVAWRRFAELPADAQGQRLWLFGVAYRVIANQRRASRPTTSAHRSAEGGPAAIATPARTPRGCHGRHGDALGR